MISTGRRPKFWTPQRKPGPPHRIEYDPNGRLSPSLISLLLFDNCLPLALPVNGLPMAMKDYASPETTFQTNFSQNTVTTCPFGGLAFHTLGTSSGDWIDYIPTNNPVTGKWSASSLVKFDGTGGYTGNVVLLRDAGASQGIGVAVGVNEFTDFTSAAFLSPDLTTIIGWRRVTITSTGSAISLYLNGVFQSSAALSVSFSLGVICDGWPWPTGDFFYWTRTLSATDVADHYADPYGTTLRPRWSPLGIVGQAAAAVGRRPSLLNLGVGP